MPRPSEPRPVCLSGPRPRKQQPSCTSLSSPVRHVSCAKAAKPPSHLSPSISIVMRSAVLAPRQFCVKIRWYAKRLNGRCCDRRVHRSTRPTADREATPSATAGAALFETLALKVTPRCLRSRAHREAGRDAARAPVRARGSPADVSGVPIEQDGQPRAALRSGGCR
eukprot:scaffold54451_cov71-Phaeocystis_antarctica.AAC.1